MDDIEHDGQSGESTFEIIGDDSPIVLDVYGTRIAQKWPRPGVFAPIAGLLAVLLLGLASYVLASNHQPNVKIQAIPRVLSLTDSQCKLVPADTFSTTIASSPTPSYNAPASNHKSHYVYVRFSRKGKLIYSTSTTGEQDDTTIWDTNGNKLFTLKGFVVGVTADNEVLALSDSGEPELLDVTGKILASVKAEVYHIDFSDVTHQFLTVDTNRMVQLWDINGKLIETLNDRFFNAGFAPSGKYIYTFGLIDEKEPNRISDEYSRIWTLEGKPVSVPGGSIVAITHDYSRYATLSDDETLSVWEGSPDDAEGRKLLTQIKNVHRTFEGPYFSPDGNYIMNQSGATVYVWDDQGHLLATIIPKGRSNNMFAYFTPDSKHIYVRDSDAGEERILDMNGNLILIISNGIKSNNDFALFSHSGGLVLAASANPYGNINCLLNTNGKLIATLNSTSPLPAKSDETGTPTFASWQRIGTDDGSYPNFSPDGSSLITLTGGSAAELWASDGTLVATLGGHDGPVEFAEFSPDGRPILTYTQTEARLWDTSGKLIATLKLADGTAKLERGQVMKITYDPEYSIGYIYLRDEEQTGLRSVELEGEIVVDFAEDGSVYGIELLNATQQLGMAGAKSLKISNEKGDSVNLPLE